MACLHCLLKNIEKWSLQLKQQGLFQTSLKIGPWASVLGPKIVPNCRPRGQTCPRWFKKVDPDQPGPANWGQRCRRPSNWRQPGTRRPANYARGSEPLQDTDANLFRYVYRREKDIFNVFRTYCYLYLRFFNIFWWAPR